MKKNENGRSMVEMLGVLAIIGVLSVAGIAGYSRAIRKHRANEIVQMVNILAMAAQSKNSGKGECVQFSNTDYFSKIAGVNVEIVANPDISPMSVDIALLDQEDEDDDESTNLCLEIYNIVGENGLYEITACGRTDPVGCS